MIDLVKRVFLWDVAQAVYLRLERVAQAIALYDWEKRRCPPAPSLLKQRTVKAYGKALSSQVLVETGTYMGAMVDACKDRFSRIYSIELDPALCRRARQRFAHLPHITILCGDSGVLLPSVLPELTQPCLFWLDAHYSGGITARGDLQTPIAQELRHILDHCPTEHAILIDDAHLFVGEDGYPTLEQVRALVGDRRPGWTFAVKDDIIRIHAPLPR